MQDMSRKPIPKGANKAAPLSLSGKMKRKLGFSSQFWLYEPEPTPELPFFFLAMRILNFFGRPERSDPKGTSEAIRREIEGN